MCIHWPARPPPCHVQLVALWTTQAVCHHHPGQARLCAHATHSPCCHWYTLHFHLGTTAFTNRWSSTYNGPEADLTILQHGIAGVNHEFILHVSLSNAVWSNNGHDRYDYWQLWLILDRSWWCVSWLSWVFFAATSQPAANASSCIICCLEKVPSFWAEPHSNSRPDPKEHSC